MTMTKELEDQLRALVKPHERSDEGEQVPGTVWPSELMTLARSAAELGIAHGRALEREECLSVIRLKAEEFRAVSDFAWAGGLSHAAALIDARGEAGGKP